MTNKIRGAAVILTCVSLSTGCDGGGGDAELVAGTLLPAMVVDSVHPIDVEIQRFAAGVDSAPTALGNASESLDDLVSTFIAALEARDTILLARSVIGPAEFIHLYFPHTVYVAPPYEMDPAFIWFQMNNLGSRGLARAFSRFGGKSAEFRGYSCPGEPLEQGPNRIWEHCLVTVGEGEGEIEVELFGPVLERGGKFKFLTYANRL